MSPKEDFISDPSIHFISGAEVIICAYFAWRRILPKVPKNSFGTLLISSVFTAVSNICLFAQVEFIPLASSQALTFMLSCILYSLLGKLVFKEDFNIAKAISVVLCLSGSALIV